MVNPKQKGDKYPEKMLCGAGVVFKFVQGFIKKYGEYYDKQAGCGIFLPAELASLRQSSVKIRSTRRLAPILLCQRSTLPRTEAVLFIHDREREMLKDDGLLYQSVCADDHGDLAVRNPFQKLRARDIRRLLTRDF